MEDKTKELIHVARKLLEKVGITNLLYYEDRIEEKHELAEFYYDDGCVYHCLKLCDDKSVYLRYSSKCGEKYFSAV